MLLLADIQIYERNYLYKQYFAYLWAWEKNYSRQNLEERLFTIKYEQEKEN